MSEQEHEVKGLGLILGSTNEKLSSRCGLVPLVRLLNKLKLDQQADRIFPKPGSNRGYHAGEMLNAAIVMLHEGGDRLEGIKHLKMEKLLLERLGLPKIPDADTLGRWLKRHGELGSKLIQKINRTVIYQTLRLSNTKSVTLDVDATVVRTTKGNALWTYLNLRGYIVMVGTIAETGQSVRVELRPGNVPPSKANLEFIKACRAQLPPGVRLKRVRIDAAGYQREVIEYLDSEKIEFVIRACHNAPVKELAASAHCRFSRLSHCHNAPVKELAASVKEEQWQALRLRDGSLSERESVVRRTHIMNVSNTPFDLVIKRKIKPQNLVSQPQMDLPDRPPKVSYNYHSIATNISGLSDSRIVHLYKQRGEHSENRIKELKSDFAVKNLPCGDFAANSFYIHLCALGYNVFALLRMTLPPEFRFARASKTRLRVYSIGGKLIRHSRQWILQIESAYYQFLKKILVRLEASLDRLADDTQYPLRN